MRNIKCEERVFVEKNNGWFMNRRYSQIYKIDLERQWVSYIGHCEENRIKANGYYITFKCGDELYLFPRNGKKNIIVYDLKTNCHMYMETGSHDNVKAGTMGVWNIGNKIFAYHHGLQRMLEIDTNMKKIIKYHKLSIPALYFSEELVNGRYLVGISLEGNQLLEFDCVSGSLLNDDLGMIHENIEHIFYNDGFYWLNENLKVYIYDKIANKVIENIDISAALNDGQTTSFLYASVSENYVWFVPLYSNKFIYINKTNKQIKVLTIKEEQEDRGKTVRYMFNYVLKNRYLFLYSRYRDQTFMIDMENAIYKDIDYKINDLDYQKVLQYQGLQRGEFVNECKNYGIKNLLLTNNSYILEDTVTDGAVGKKIYNMLITE